tara:strand:+ start:14530 stop:14772 length:243 start_codon:yes stop_codon:yes gene_type:complete
MKVTVKCFSQVKYALKVNQIFLDLEPGQTTADVEEAVRKHATGKLDGISLRIAVNRVYVQEPVVVEDGDEVALIPPVQGG